MTTQKKHPRHLTTLIDYTPKELRQILDLAKDLKNRRKEGNEYPYLLGKTLALIFHKPSNRTRISFEVGTYQLGGHVVYIKDSDIKMGAREPIFDIARVMSRYVDAVLIRTIEHDHIEEFASYSSVPVINGLSNRHHPCQGLADVFSIEEALGKIAGAKIVFVGDGNNVCCSLINVAARLGASVTLCCPPGYELDKNDVCADYEVIHDPAQALPGADVIYTDVWTSIGQDEDREQRTTAFSKYRVTPEMLELTGKSCLFMHCLPANRQEEVSSEVIDGPTSIVIDQAENRLHVQKAVLTYLMTEF